MELLLFLAILGEVWLFAKLHGARQEAAKTREELQYLKIKLTALTDVIRGMRDTDTISPPPSRAMEQVERVENFEETMKILEARKAPVIESSLPPPLPVSQIEEEQPWEEEAPPTQNHPPEEPKEPFSLERFMGVKLFAWLGGVAMFFGVIFFVRYAFEKNLIPPEMRIALGYATGGLLLAGGLFAHRLPRYKVLGQAFCATAVLILYGVTFAAHAIYHFPAFGTGSTLVIMGGVTVLAFVLALRLDALVVAVLGMLGGFLTPILLSTGQDQVFGLFGYIALLDIGLVALSRKNRWGFLAPCAAVGTMLMQAGWFLRFFDQGRYEFGAKTLVPMGILLFFMMLFLAGGWIGKKGWRTGANVAGSVLMLATLATVFAFLMLGREAVAERYFLLHGFLLAVQLLVILAVGLRPSLGIAQVVAAGLGFLHLAAWTRHYLTAGNLNGMLVVFLAFGSLHAAAAVLLARRPETLRDGWQRKTGSWFAPLALLLMAIAVMVLSPVPMSVWLGILVANLLVIGLAVMSGAAAPVLVSLFLTMAVAAAWLLKGPAVRDSLMPFLTVITGFSILFSLAGSFLSRRALADGNGIPAQHRIARWLPVCSSLLPFGMLILALLRLPVEQPSLVFGVALLMSALLGGLAIFGNQGRLLLAALGGTLAVEMVWHLQDFRPDSPLLPLGWYLGFYALFLGFPFVFRKACTEQAAPWIASALSGVGHFILIHDLVKRSYPNDVMGLLPAAFALPAFAALAVVIRQGGGMDALRRSRLAWFGGVALFFVTLIFPIQFDHQWLTVSWAMEGALLLWLFKKVPHPGLQLTGFALLAITFIRLSLNPAVFIEYPRSGTAILNWQLYTYALVAAAQFIGAGWFSNSQGKWKAMSPRAILNGFGGVLLFLLVNIEIADFFTAPDARYVAFEFGGNFARDMTYTIAWGLFSLGLLGIGIWLKSKYARFAAIGLLAVTLLKLFLHDLANIESIFRIGALIGVAVIAFFASFLYQRFFERTDGA